jgi:hypothetical protein
LLFVTASQLNRSAVDEIEFDHSHIAGGISKINTADNVFGIFTSRAMRERGKYQIQCMKSRSSTGVGMKIDLEYNIETMRISDLGGDEEGGSSSSSQSSGHILNKIKASSNVDVSPIKIDPETGEITSLEPVKKIQADARSSMLHNMLNQLKKT